MNVTDLSPAAQTLAGMQPRIADCGCLAGSACTTCRPIRRKILTAAALGQTADRISVEHGIDRQAIVAELALERRRQREERQAKPKLRRAAAQRELFIAAFGLTGITAGHVAKGNSLPNLPFGEEFQRRNRAHIRAAVRTGGYDPHDTYIGRLARHLGMDTSGLQRGLGLRAESVSRKKVKTEDGGTTEVLFGGHFRTVIALRTAERIADFWSLDPIDLIEQHPLVQQERTRRAQAARQSRHTKGTTK